MFDLDRLVMRFAVMVTLNISDYIHIIDPSIVSEKQFNE